MAEETMVKEPLRKEMIEAGKALIKRLANSNVNLSSAFWFYSPETNEWQLVLAFPQVDTDGPKKAYESIQSVLYPPLGSSPQREDEHRVSPLYLQDITVLSPNHPLVRSLKSAISTEMESEGIQFTRSRIGDVFVEDTYIYRVR